MLFLVELDHVKSGIMPTAEAGKEFIERFIFPTLDRAEELVTDKTILAGGPVAGRIALRLIVEAESSEELDRIITSLPIWPVAETRVTLLATFSERRASIEALLAKLVTREKS